MKKEDLIRLKEELSKLSEAEKKLRDLHLKDIADGKVYGPMVGYPSIDKPWLKYYDTESLTADIPKMTVYQYMCLNNFEHLDDIAIEYFGTKIKYRQLLKKIDEVAKALVSNGIKKGDIVSICSITTPEVIYLFYALNKIGAIANMIDPRTNDERIIDIINSTDSKVLFSLDMIYPKIEKMKKQLNVEKYINLSVYTSMSMAIRLLKEKKNQNSASDWNDFIAIAKDKPQVESVNYETNYPAAIVYTGGTTGISKGAILSNDNMNALVFQYKISNLGFKRQQKMLDIMPPFIAYGLDNGIHMPISLGITDIIVPKFEPEKFADYILKYKPNGCLGVPSHFDILTKSEKLKNADLSFITYPVVGGDAMNISLEEKLNKFLKEHNCKSKITKGYGMTELSGAAVTSSIPANKVASVGIPFSTNNLGIFTPGTDEELPLGEVGEICLTSPTMMYDYLNNPEEAKKVKKQHSDGKVWVHSQDYGYIDEDGFLYIKGRIKRTIVRPDGHNNYPLEIENVINSHPAVANSAIVNFNADKYGNGTIPIAFIVLNDETLDHEVMYKELCDYCAKKLPKRDVACHFMFIKKLPLTNVGKVNYQELEKCLITAIEENSKIADTIYENYEKSLVLK